MHATQAVGSRVYEEIEGPGGPDPVIRALWLGIAFVVVLLLVGALYVLLAGLISPSGPRTAVEARLVTAEDAVKRYPDSGEARFDRIVSLGAVGRYSEASRAAQRAKKELKGVEAPWAYLGEATVLFGRQKYDQSLAVAIKGLEVQDAAAKEQVAEYAAKQITINPGTLSRTAAIRLHMLQAQNYARLEKWQESLDALSSALEIDSQAADVLVLRAQTYQQLGENDKAKADYERALEFIPDYEPAISGLSQIEQ